MKTSRPIPFLAAALLLAIAAVPSLADLTHAWFSASAPAAPLGAIPTDSIGNTGHFPSASLNTRIAALLDDDFLVPRVSSAIALQGTSSAKASSGGNFEASDSFSSEPYASSGTFNIGDNGGSGFGEWRLMGSAEPNRVADARDFAIYANDGVGEAAIGRSFAGGTALGSGTFSVGAYHGFASSFSGFAIYGGESEIFRWGVTTTEDREGGTGDRTGFWYAIGADGQPDYLLLAACASETILQAQLTYSLTWSTIPGGLSLELGIQDAAGEIAISETLEALTDSSAVTAIAAIVTGTSGQGALHFDNLAVEGLAVPEPATLALFLLGALAIRPFRRFR